MKKRICGVAGNSGGHLLPCLSYLEQHCNLASKDELLFFHAPTQLDRTLVAHHTRIDRQVELPLGNVPSLTTWWRIPLFATELMLTAIKTLYFLIRYRPCLIVSTGGYIAIPVCIIGWLLRIRVELFELNSVPGKAIIFLAPFAWQIHVCFPESAQTLPQKRCVLTPYPLKPVYMQPALTKAQALVQLRLSPNKKTLLILGGSQGSVSLNHLVTLAFADKKNFNTTWQIIHQAGAGNSARLIQFYAEQNIEARVFDFHDHLETVYPAADIIICRAGAGTLFETAHFAKRCIMIPLETQVTSHQVDNAQSFTKRFPQEFSLIGQHEVQADPAMLYFAVVLASAAPDSA